VAARLRKLIVITGVTRGLGCTLTKGLVRLGHTVIGCGRNAARIADLGHSLGRPLDFTALDVGLEQAVEVWAQQVQARLGPPDLLINNAALINSNAPLWKISSAEFDQVIDVNIKGVANVIRHFVPAMIARGSGVIVNFSSGWGRSTAPDVAPYCASKWAIEGLTRTLAEELPHGMAAIPLNPGIIDTDMLRTCFGESASAYQTPRQWAKVAIPFLLRLGPHDNGKPLTVR
jgi:NAD(P)-dependent dehydrogenase (short-subunit alcohol dehydrogenase family)